MSKDLFFQVRESEQLNQDAPIPTEYLIIYPNYNQTKNENPKNQNQRLQGNQRP